MLGVESEGRLPGSHKTRCRHGLSIEYQQLERIITIPVQCNSIPLYNVVRIYSNRQLETSHPTTQ